MKKLLLILSVLFFAACSKEELPSGVCLGDCETLFYVDHPGAYLDDNNIWHVQYQGFKYFNIRGQVSELQPEHVVNGVPLIETHWDTDYVKWDWDLLGLGFRIPDYEPYGTYEDSWYNTAWSLFDIFGWNVIDPNTGQQANGSICYMATIAEINNVAGYSINDKICPDCPYTDTLMGVYSKNNYTPTQQIYLDEHMEGDTLTVWIKTKFNYDVGESVEKIDSLNIKIDFN